MAIRTVSELRKRAAAGETLDFLFLGAPAQARRRRLQELPESMVHGGL